MKNYVITSGKARMNLINIEHPDDDFFRALGLIQIVFSISLNYQCFLQDKFRNTITVAMHGFDSNVYI